MMKYDEMDSFRMINPFLDVKNSSKPPVSKGPAHKSGALYDLYGTVGSVTSDFGWIYTSFGPKWSKLVILLRSSGKTHLGGVEAL